MALSWVAYTCIAILLASVYVRKRLAEHTSQLEREAHAEKPGRIRSNDGLSASARQLRNRLVATIPHIVITPDSPEEFLTSTNAYWDRKACEAQPSCVVRPRNVWELVQAVKILRQEFDRRIQQSGESKEDLEPVFAVRGGGHSAVEGASSIAGGVLIDLSLFKQVVLAEDKKSTVIGAGCRWIDVYSTLEKDGVAVVGGRNSAVGVAGLALGGGLSFFSPQHGFVCSNIIEYEIVLADGSVVTASEQNNPDLWRALKGGGNNFGIVTRFTARTFPCTHIWSGFVYYLGWQAPKILSAFHSVVARPGSSGLDPQFDPQGAGPLACFTYLQALGIQVVAVNIVQTSPDVTNSKWPANWLNSSFKNIWRVWSTCKVRTLSDATDELNAVNPPQRRQEFATTTVKNDKDTLFAAHIAYRDAIKKIKRHNIKGMSWTLVVQPLLPCWMRRGDANPMGLDEGDDEPLVVVSFTVNWALNKDDEVVRDITREAIEQIDAFAREKGTMHRYRYLNYCAKWQKPFGGYGQENFNFLRRVSREVDPEGLFQRGCNGGFKLEL
ncbi:hypothetical protein yc1106_08787 [Curvularia clavata]|uniref:FAD-binding PCMH-type domain-containing protein n=1 Tax=Curvularia clavata TaxID=95742 RepID=A0A9Q8ZK07_CURCL|nr:hypothetical protein yc1106_08787 [Curvularia clavata]